ncbi:host-nuclease inhibitor protein [Burkholderia phage vB_BglM_WTB]
MQNEPVEPDSFDLPEPPPIDFFEESENPAPVGEDSLLRITKLSIEAKELEVKILETQEELATLQSQYDKITMNLIPTIFEELGIHSFKLQDGSEVQVNPDIKVGITEANKPAAFRYLRENDFDGIIKESVSLQFGKGEGELSKKAQEALTAAGFTPQLKEDVHYQTLRSFAKERLEAGDANFPQEVFGVWPFKKAKIVIPKTKKKRSK